MVQSHVVYAHSFLKELCGSGDQIAFESESKKTLSDEDSVALRGRQRLAAMREAFTGCYDWTSFYDGSFINNQSHEVFKERYRDFAYSLAEDSLRMHPDAMAFERQVKLYTSQVDRKTTQFNPAQIIAGTLSPFQLSILFRESLETYGRIYKATLSRSSVSEASGFYLYVHERVFEIVDNVKIEAEALLDLAARCISPNGESFSLETLIEKFNFPAYQQDDFPNYDDF